MRWSDTVASGCRYGDCAEMVFGDGEVIWEDSYADYQGSAEVLVAMPDGRIGHYEWSYGSCSGCDSWEAGGDTDDMIAHEMDNETAWFTDYDAVERYLSKMHRGYFNANTQDAYTAFVTWRYRHEGE
jgi:hypothetical protein